MNIRAQRTDVRRRGLNVSVARHIVGLSLVLLHRFTPCTLFPTAPAVRYMETTFEGPELFRDDAPRWNAGRMGLQLKRGGPTPSAPNRGGGRTNTRSDNKR